MARPNVPKFGDWKNDDNVPYTVYFTEARKKKGGKMINPNDPRENPDMFANIESSAPGSGPGPGRAPPSRNRPQREEPIGRGANKAAHQRPVSGEDGEIRPFSDSPARSYNGGRGDANDQSTHQRYGGRGRGSGRGNGSPDMEGIKRPNERSQGTPVRSRMNPNSRGDEARDRDVAIPVFGEWDVNDPQSADKFTSIFKNHSRNGNASGTNSAPSHNNTTPKQNADHDVKFSLRSCFPWCKK